jgi:hypothetical protein
MTNPRPTPPDASALALHLEIELVALLATMPPEQQREFVAMLRCRLHRLTLGHAFGTELHESVTGPRARLSTGGRSA